MFLQIITALSALLLSTGAEAEQPHAVEALQEYMEFATYSSGAISPEQLEHEGYDRFFIVDTRNAGQYGAGHLPNAVNIEWRNILSRRDELPTDRPILLYCETGLLSSKAHLALGVAGFENVKVLWGGYIIWSARQSFDDAQRLKQALSPNRRR
jgi:rhodanese-related sulfurtransferase